MQIAVFILAVKVMEFFIPVFFVCFVNFITNDNLQR